MPGQRREGAGLVGQHEPGDELGPVAGGDHRAVGAQPVEHVRQAHRGHDRSRGCPGRARPRCRDQLAVRGLDQRPEGRGGRGAGSPAMAAVTGVAERLEPRRHGGDGRRADAVGDDRHRLGVVGPQLGERDLGRGVHLRRGCARGRARPARPGSRGWPRSGR